MPGSFGGARRTGSARCHRGRTRAPDPRPLHRLHGRRPPGASTGDRPARGPGGPLPGRLETGPDDVDHQAAFTAPSSDMLPEAWPTPNLLSRPAQGWITATATSVNVRPVNYLMRYWLSAARALYCRIVANFASNLGSCMRAVRAPGTVSALPRTRTIRTSDRVPLRAGRQRSSIPATSPQGTDLRRKRVCNSMPSVVRSVAPYPRLIIEKIMGEQNTATPPTHHHRSAAGAESPTVNAMPRKVSVVSPVRHQYLLRSVASKRIHVRDGTARMLPVTNAPATTSVSSKPWLEKPSVGAERRAGANVVCWSPSCTTPRDVTARAGAAAHRKRGCAGSAWRLQRHV